jgi:hypothetical protein
MTKSLQKKRERFFAEEAARLLGEPWDFGADREHPDFIVRDGDRQFGLEVTQIFVGPRDDAGSALKAAEAKTHRVVNNLRREYETVENIPLIAKFIGNMEADNLATVIRALLAQDLPSKPVGHRFPYDTESCDGFLFPIQPIVISRRATKLNTNFRTASASTDRAEIHT